MMRLFLNFELGKLSKYYKTRTGAKTLTTVLFLLVFTVVGVGIYGFLVSGFRTISFESDPDIRIALTLFIYEVFLLILASIIVLSSLISGIFNLFRTEYNTFLISSPGYGLFPRVVLMRSILSSLLPSIIMFVPAILALNKVYKVGLIGSLTLSLSVVLLLVLINTFTLFVLTTFSYCYYRLTQISSAIKFNIQGLISSMMVLLVLIGIWASQILSRIDLVKLFRADEGTDTTISLQTVGNYFVYLPTHPFALQILSLQNKEYGKAYLYFGILLLLTFISFIIWKISKGLFYKPWQLLQEGSRRKERESARKVSMLGYTFGNGSTSLLFKKEMLIASRNMKGVLWFLFLFTIWLMQIGANTILGKNLARYQGDVSEKLLILQTFQFIIALYFIAAFTLRFVFPSFSTEKKTAWIVGSAPLSFRKIFFGKYLFYTLFFVVIGIMMSYINTLVLGLSISSALLSMVLLIVSIVSIVTFGLSLGAAFPNKESDDPEVVSTSGTGFLFTALALIYGAVSTWILLTTLRTGVMLWFVLFIIVSLVLAALTLVRISHMKKQTVS